MKTEIEALKKTYTSVCLPLREAVEFEAKQNIQRDIYTRCLRLRESKDPEVIRVYREEAEYLLKRSGHGYLPEYRSHKLVILKK